MNLYQEFFALGLACGLAIGTFGMYILHERTINKVKVPLLEMIDGVEGELVEAQGSAKYWSDEAKILAANLAAANATIEAHGIKAGELLLSTQQIMDELGATEITHLEDAVSSNASAGLLIDIDQN